MPFDNSQPGHHQFQTMFPCLHNANNVNLNSCYNDLPRMNNCKLDPLGLGPIDSNLGPPPPFQDGISSCVDNTSEHEKSSSSSNSSISSSDNSPPPPFCAPLATTDFFNCSQAPTQQLPGIPPLPPLPPPPIPSLDQLARLSDPQDGQSKSGWFSDENSDSSSGTNAPVFHGNIQEPGLNTTRSESEARSSSDSGSNGSINETNATAGPLEMHRNTLQKLLQEQNIKKRRLARKAELARESRKKKKMRIMELEQEVADLKAELEMVRKQAAHAPIKKNENKQELCHKDITNIAKEIVTTYKQSLSHNSNLIKQEMSTQLEELVRQLVFQFKEKCYSTTSRLEALESALVPGLPLQFLQWALGQSNKFYEDPSGLWQSIVQEIKASPEQANDFLKLREAASRQRGTSMKIESAFANLASSLKAQLSHNELLLRQISRILDPQQIGVLFHWIEKFGHVCVKINL